ncbi:hypothetical protein D3C85_920440 [compost metagenome]
MNGNFTTESKEDKSSAQRKPFCLNSKADGKNWNDAYIKGSCINAGIHPAIGFTPALL